MKADKSTLPGTMHGLLKAALDDAERIGRFDKDVEYFPDDGNWFKISNSIFDDETTARQCYFCLAGSLIVSGRIAVEGGELDERKHMDEQMPVEDWKKMLALDCMRKGQWRPAKNYLGIEERISSELWHKLDSSLSRTEWYGWEEFEEAIAELRECQAILEEAGL